jgi:AraC-like DNA-binding protein
MGKFSFTVLTERELQLPFYLVGAGIDFNQDLDPHSRPKGYPHYQWIQCEKGEGLLHLGDREVQVGPDDGMLLYPEVPHEYYPTTSPWLVHWLTFGGNDLPQLLPLLGLESSDVYSVIYGEQIINKIRIIFYHLLSETSMKGIECSALVYDFLITLMKYTYRHDNEAVAQQYQRLEPVLHYIRDHYPEVITIDDLAATIDVTPQHLCHLFKETMNHRPFEYVNTYRITKSKALMIKEPETPITDIAERCGYESVGYFSSVFRKYEGISPGSYRKLHLPQR